MESGAAILLCEVRWFGLSVFINETEAPIIEVEHLMRAFGSVKAVDGVTFSVGRGKVVGFIGANGAGKTTTMRMLVTLDTPTSGTIRNGGVDVN